MRTEDQDELRIAREAVTWRMRLQSEGRACHAAFEAWLMESRRHLEAYLLAATISPRLRALDPLREIDVEALISQAEGRRVVPLNFERRDTTEGAVDPAQKGAADSARTRPRVRKAWAAAAAVLLVVVAPGFFLVVAPISRGAETYSTVVGEQRKVKLKDGSLVYLNTNSQVHVRYTAAARDIQLLKGEALFTVERDIQRPFRVLTGTAVVNALGTEFDVYRQSARTVIEVVKGEVNVQPPGKDDSKRAEGGSSHPDAPTPVTPEPGHLKSGETASVDLAGKIHRDTPNVQLAQNWQQRRLVFNGEPLKEVAAEFNRYNQAQIIVEGKELGARPVEGIFSADHPQTLFLFLMKEDKRVVVDTHSAESIIRFRSQDGS